VLGSQKYGHDLGRNEATLREGNRGTNWQHSPVAPARPVGVRWRLCHAKLRSKRATYRRQPAGKGETSLLWPKMRTSFMDVCRAGDVHVLAGRGVRREKTTKLFHSVGLPVGVFASIVISAHFSLGGDVTYLDLQLSIDAQAHSRTRLVQGSLHLDI